MAGSFRHIVTDDGKLGNWRTINNMLDNMGDVYETLEEMYGMIWFLAEGDASQVREAQHTYKMGLERSPGKEK